ncbi:MAG TPA: hypothetical protein VHC43_07525 [Mycobacteriales bacterium]|nr:hypothetical protein [Mycobacteriales bacterium]
MTDEPVAARSRRRPLAVGACLVAALAVAVSVVLTGTGGGTSRGPQSPAGPHAAAPARLHAIQSVLDARSAAILDRDRAAFMAGVDPAGRQFRRKQSRMFADLAPVPISAWSYSVSATRRPPPPDVARYDAPTWAPSYVVVHYRLTDFDDVPTSLKQYPTFVERDGRWYLASLSDYAEVGHRSATDLWDFGPVKVLRSAHVLVLGAPSQLATMSEVARAARAAIGPVDAVWGRQWARRVVVLVPATVREMGVIDDYSGDLQNIAALTSAEVSSSAGNPAPVGDRITINPVSWPLLSDVGAAVVIRHELTHVATRAATGTQTPTWLSEGFADYVGFRAAPVSIGVAAADLAHLVATGQVPTALPTNHDFRSSNPELAAHYEAAWFACRYIAGRFGQSTLVRFYRAVGMSSHRSSVALAVALRDVLHLQLDEFVARWRHYMVATLS